MPMAFPASYLALSLPHHSLLPASPREPSQMASCTHASCRSSSPLSKLIEVLLVCCDLLVWNQRGHAAGHVKGGKRLLSG
ncbi:hypothetical protein BRADI_3g18025v3 [Brachypodium distachyon]|uniref:Uncharacterized protein n=1 Tax=Brachypodium distachyon TaxID=15368 RepID=A0A2K2CXX5_BRADI|nr:hypothetical protein BRADI_3g18025v3 [Brachypodium distachyon]